MPNNLFRKKSIETIQREYDKGLEDGHALGLKKVLHVKYYLLAAVILFVSCKQKREEPELKLDNFVFANYWWGIDTNSLQWEFRLGLYARVQRNGVMEIVSRQINSPNTAFFQYYEDTLSDSLINEINQLLENRKLRKWSHDRLEYVPTVDGVVTYYLSFIGQDSIKQEVSFNLSYGRKYQPLDSVRRCLINFINNHTLHETKSFSIDSIFNYLKSYSLQNDPFLPISKTLQKPPKIELKLFTIPKVIHKNAE
jgi:hypothetical protein